MTDPDDGIDNQVRRYRQLRLQRAEAARQRSLTEAEELVALARVWAPYGGVSDSDIFIRFGITRAEFVERLWALPLSTMCGRHTIDLLTKAYRRPSADNASGSESASQSRIR